MDSLTTTIALTYETLKDRQREVRSEFPESLALRTHRALSWLHRAEQEVDDLDAQFIFLWISFNAAYANDIPDRAQFSEKRLLFSFLNKLIDVDRDKLLYQIVWDHFPESIRLLIDNEYVFQPYWDCQRGLIEEQRWRDAFAHSKRRATRALGKMQTKKVVAEIFSRLYVLRNQLIHGSSTWSGGVNRRQITDGARILGFVVPVLLHLMIENPRQLWGDPLYPVIQ